MGYSARPCLKNKDESQEARKEGQEGRGKERERGTASKQKHPNMFGQISVCQKNTDFYLREIFKRQQTGQTKQ